MKLAFYADDFTGATDTLGTLARAGLRALLLPGIPSAAQLAALGPLDALGIAGAARSMAPAAMRAELEPVGRFFASLNVAVMHYKTCSTFDSSPQTGSIGTAIEVLRRHAPNPLVAIVGGQPNLNRYCLFGNLFAAAQTGGSVYRLDRHPTMRAHPVTPMHEADLRLHLREQGLARVVNIAYPSYDEPTASQHARLARTLAEDADAVLFDVGQRTHLAPVGRLLWQQARQARLLAVGPSGVTQALIAAWHEADAAGDFREGSGEGSDNSGGQLDTLGSRAEAVAMPAAIAPANGPVLVLAGSLSPITAQQIDAAVSYERVPLDAARLLARDQTYLDALHAQLAGLLQRGRHVLAATNLPGAVRADTGASAALAVACGALLARLLQRVRPGRVGVAGGDTSSLALQALAVSALEYAGEIAPGVMLCRARADSAALDGLELMLKGGQVGAVDVFERLVHGTANPPMPS